MAASNEPGRDLVAVAGEGALGRGHEQCRAVFIFKVLERLSDCGCVAEGQRNASGTGIGV